MSNVMYFAEACYDQNSLKELMTALAGAADETEMKIWNLTEAEWREALKIAIIAMEKDINVEEAMKKK